MCVVVVTVPFLPLHPLCVVESGREIWNLTVEHNSNYANVSWRHNFPAGSNEFVLEFTLDSKKADSTRHESSKKKVFLQIIQAGPEHSAMSELLWSRAATFR